MESFIIMRVDWKIRFLGRGFTKNQYIGGNYLERGGLGQFVDLRGLDEKEGGGVLIHKLKWVFGSTLRKSQTMFC